MRLTIKAFNAAFPVWIRVYQKLIRRYEHKPTPSQPKNNTKKLLAQIKINIKKVNKDKYARKRIKCGSCFI